MIERKSPAVLLDSLTFSAPAQGLFDMRCLRRCMCESFVSARAAASNGTLNISVQAADRPAINGIAKTPMPGSPVP